VMTAHSGTGSCSGGWTLLLVSQVRRHSQTECI